MQMKRYIILLGVAALSFSACKTVRKTQANPAVDHSGKVVAVDDAKKAEKDYALKLLNEIRNNKIDFNTFSAKIGLQFQSPKMSQSANANLRMEKNKVIWMSVTGPFGIEVFRAKVTPDSVVLIDKLQSKVIRRDTRYLQSLVKVPVNFYDLQDLLVGNPVFINGEPESFQNSSDNIQYTLVADAIRNLLTVMKSNTGAAYASNSQVSEATSSRTANITYGDYRNLSGKNFSYLRNIVVKENGATTNIHLEYKEPVFDQPVTFPFSVPRGYSEG